MDIGFFSIRYPTISSRGQKWRKLSRTNSDTQQLKNNGRRRLEPVRPLIIQATFNCNLYNSRDGHLPFPPLYALPLPVRPRSVTFFRPLYDWSTLSLRSCTS